MEAVEKRGLKDLSDETAQALRQFLTQVHSHQRNSLFWEMGIKILELVSFILFMEELNLQNVLCVTDWVQHQYVTFLSW